MQAISNALNNLLESGSWFVRASEVKLWVIRANSSLRKTAEQMLVGLEFHNDNYSAWVLLPDAHTLSDQGWRHRANRLLGHWEERRKAFRERENLLMPEALPARDILSAGTISSAMAPFKEACLGIDRALREPLRGGVIVFAPTLLDNLETMEVEIQTLACDPDLRRFRWVWVLDASQPWPNILGEFGEFAIRCECIPDPEQQKKDFDALVSPGTAAFGRAGPRSVKPPRRVDDPPEIPREQRDELLRKEGVNPDYLDKAPELQRLILGAAIAMKDGKGAEAIRQQRDACDLAASLLLHDVAVLCRIALSSYLSGLGLLDEALDELRLAIKVARSHQLILPEAQAHLAAALTLALDKCFIDAADEYAESARCAENAKMPVLAIEAWRMAGQANLSADLEVEAADCFRHAIRVADHSEVATVQNSTASEVARKLAALYAKRGLPDQEQSLYEQADAMENGLVGVKTDNDRNNKIAEVEKGGAT
jgi:hypothetical protein